MTSAPSEFRRPLARYIAGVTLAHLMAATEVLLVMAALGHETHGAIGEMFAGHSAVIVSTVVVLAVLAIAVGAAWIFLPTLRWYGPGVEPTAAQRENTLAIPRRQTALLATVWVVSALPVLLANRGAAGPIGLMIIPPLVFGATAAILTALLLTVRTLRPMTAAALPDGAAADATHDTAPSVMARLLSVWVLISALPSFGVAGLILARANGWLIERSASLELPILLLMAVGVLWGLRAMILVSQSISDPVRDVVEAMADVEHGNLEHTVSVYERSEIGRLQTGFNRMVLGLQYQPTSQIDQSRLQGAAPMNPASRVWINPVIDQHPEGSRIGVSQEEDNAAVYFGRGGLPPADFLRAALTQVRPPYGVPIHNDPATATHVLEIRMSRFWTVEANLYQTWITGQVLLADRGGNILWQSEITGFGKRWGRTFTAENYLHAFSDAALEFGQNLALTPAFRQGDYAGGLEAGADRIMARIRGEALPAPATKPQGTGQSGFDLEDLAIFLFFAVPVGAAVLRSIFGRKLGALFMGGAVGAVALFITSSLLVAGLAGVVAMLVALFSSFSGVGSAARRGGGWGGGGWSSGGSGGWSGGSGGFSSGGGGDFGGGGASGDW